MLPKEAMDDRHPILEESLIFKIYEAFFPRSFNTLKDSLIYNFSKNLFLSSMRAVSYFDKLPKTLLSWFRASLIYKVLNLRFDRHA